MKSSIIITTYEDPSALELVLRGLLRQTAEIDEVIFADDGSTDHTRDLIARFDRETDFDVLHLWHQHRGIQKAAIVNAAMAVAKGDNFVFLDGDCIPDRLWLADHLREADGKTVWQGRRIQLGPKMIQRITPEDVSAGRLEGWLSPRKLLQLLRRDQKNLHLAIRIPRTLVRVFEKRKGLMGCNFSAPRAVLESVNGYDASWVGAQYLCEDLDLEIRLRQQGVPLSPLLHAANVFHRNHERPKPSDFAHLREERWKVTDSRAVDGIREAAERIREGSTRNLLDP